MNLSLWKLTCVFCLNQDSQDLQIFMIMTSSMITACSSHDYKDATILSGFRTLYNQQSWKSYNLVNPDSDKYGVNLTELDL